LDLSSYLKSQTATERQLVWKQSKPLIAENWVMGVGPGNWKLQFPGHGVEGNYRMQDQNVFFTRAHNDYLEVLAELGVVGLLLYLLLFGFCLHQLYQCRLSEPWKSRMLLVGLGGYMVMSFIDFPKERIEFIILLSIYLGLSDICSRSKGLQTSRPVAKMITTLMMIAMLGNLYTGFYRYQGEINTKKMLKARAADNWQEVIRVSSKAKNKWHHLDPSSVPVDFYTGVAYYNLGEKAKAMAVFKNAQEIAPYNFHILNNLATLEIEQQNYEVAIPLLKEALRINSRFEDALYNLAYCYTEEGKFQEALNQVEAIPTDSEKKALYKAEIQKRMKPTGDDH
jgi:tetratricopeptide (TPR) repeat protein